MRMITFYRPDAGPCLINPDHVSVVEPAPSGTLIYVIFGNCFTVAENYDFVKWKLEQDGTEK